MASLMKRARVRDRNLRERYGKACRRLRKGSPRTVFRLDDIYRDGVWWSCYSARPKCRQSSCESWRDVADRLEKSKRIFMAILRYFGAAEKQHGAGLIRGVDGNPGSDGRVLYPKLWTDGAKRDGK